MKLRIAPTLTLPLDTVTKTNGILAQRRKGKTYLASVIAEEMVAADLPFVALDPTGAWWGLRSSADGQSAGLPVVVLGGQHGDVPLERDAGKFVAELVVDNPGWYILDFSLFESNAAEAQFAADFAERLYRRKGQANSDFPMHLFVDECDRFVPQRVRQGETTERTLGAFEAIVRRGGQRGLGTTLISQRPAVVNKNVLEQLDALFVLRVVGPNDQRAIADYVGAHGTPAQLAEMNAALASLEIGEAFYWEPGEDIFKRVRIRQRKTFNSSATPKPGEKRIVPKRLADVDLEAVTKQMAATIEKAKADDPKELRKQIAERDKRIKELSNAGGRSERDAEAYKREALAEQADAMAEMVRDLREARSECSQMYKLIGTVNTELTSLAGRVVQRADAINDKMTEPTSGATKPVPRRELPKREPDTKQCDMRRDIPRSSNGSTPDEVTAPQLRILNAIAAFEPLGLDRISKPVAAIYAGVSPTSGGYFNNLSKLRSLGLIEYPSGGDVALTAEGRAVADPPNSITSVSELHEAWYRMLPNPQAYILRALVSAYPDSISKDELANKVSVSPTSGGYFNNLSRLRSLGAIDYPSSGRAVATELLFPAGVPA